MFKKKPFIPIYSLLLSNRIFCTIVVFFPIVFIVMGFIHHSPWTCPLVEMFGIECAGCGMTRAALNLFKGNIIQAIHYHPLAPPLFITWLVAIIALLLPPKTHKNLVEKIEIVEKKTGIAFIFIALFFLYGTLRMLIQGYYHFNIS